MAKWQASAAMQGDARCRELRSWPKSSGDPGPDRNQQHQEDTTLRTPKCGYKQAEWRDCIPDHPPNHEAHTVLSLPTGLQAQSLGHDRALVGAAPRRAIGRASRQMIAPTTATPQKNRTAAQLSTLLPRSVGPGALRCIAVP